MPLYTKSEIDTFSWKIEKFSELESKYVSEVFVSKNLNDSLWYLDLYVSEYGPEKRKFISIFLNKSKDENKLELIVQIDLTITILANDISSNISRKSISNMFGNFNGFRRIVSVEELYRKKNLYLPNDILSVECYIEGKFGDPHHPTVPENELSENVHETAKCDIQNLGNDLLRLYLDSKFCDIEITTGDRVFSVHKTVICARSRVFSAMFENDTQEKNSGVVDIPDVDSATMNRMLTYMYSDVIEDMDFKEVEKMYVAADKYEVLPLKKHCSSVLKSIISVENLADIYSLSDMHQDRDLKTAVEGYVFVYMKKIFKSSEWKKFMELNAQLSAELMHNVLLKLVEG